jgi:hypothetical protein
VIAPRLEEPVAGSAKILNRLLGEDIQLATTLSQEPLTVTIDPGQLARSRGPVIAITPSNQHLA